MHNLLILQSVAKLYQTIMEVLPQAGEVTAAESIITDPNCQKNQTTAQHLAEEAPWKRMEMLKT